jgi:hypothetical protein
MDVNELPPPPKSHKAIGIGLLAATSLYTIATLVGKSYGGAFFSIPFFVGFATGALAPRKPYRASLVVLVLALLLAIVTLREGVVCVLFALPLIVPLQFAGAFAGQVLRRHFHTPRSRATGVGLMLVAGAGWQVVDAHYDDPLRHPVHVATTEMHIAAPPERVFATLVGARWELANRWPWFLTIGLPVPRTLTFEAPGPRGRLRLDFSQGTAFAHVTDWREGRELAFEVDRYQIHDLPFHITRLGRSPDYGFRAERVEDWMTLLELRYSLAPAADGGTLITRRTTWRRHLAPSIYFGWLQQTIVERGQRRLLELVRERIMDAPMGPPIAERSLLDVAPDPAASKRRDEDVVGSVRGDRDVVGAH